MVDGPVGENAAMAATLLYVGAEADLVLESACFQNSRKLLDKCFTK